MRASCWRSSRRRDWSNEQSKRFDKDCCRCLGLEELTNARAFRVYLDQLIEQHFNVRVCWVCIPVQMRLFIKQGQLTMRGRSSPCFETSSSCLRLYGQWSEYSVENWWADNCIPAILVTVRGLEKDIKSCLLYFLTPRQRKESLQDVPAAN